MFSGTQEKCATCGKTAYPLEKVHTHLYKTYSYDIKLELEYGRVEKRVKIKTVCKVMQVYVIPQTGLNSGNSGESSVPQVMFQVLSWRVFFISIKLCSFGGNLVLQASFFTAIQGEGKLQSSHQVCIHQTLCSNNSSCCNNRRRFYSRMMIFIV